MVAISSTVHTEETTGTTPDFRSYGERLRSRCSTEWGAADTMYRFLDRHDHRDRAWNLRDCRKSAWFMRHKVTGQVTIISSHCGLRWCPLCSNARANYIRHSVTEWLRTADHPKFLTLTIKHTNEPLIDQVRKLYDSFRKLRRCKGFTKHVNGGVWFFQICRNVQEGQWHPHLHCIITGEYIPVRFLQNLWHKITVDSHVLKLQTITDPGRVASEVARYASRPANLSSFGVKVGVELYEAMHGKRLCGKWGLFTKVQLSIARNPEMKEWEKVGSFLVVTQYSKSSDIAKQILEAYKTNQPLPPDINLNSIDSFCDSFGEYEPNELTVDLPPPEKKLF